MLESLKKQYGELASKYQLPSFTQVNADFELEKIDHESECLMRTIRKCMMDKIVNSLSFFDMLLQPAQAPRLYLPFIRTMTQEDQEHIELLYKAFGTLSLQCLTLELEYNESAEASMVTRIFTVWQEERVRFLHLVTRIEHPIPFLKKEKSYFG